MKRIWYLSTCDTCKRIIKELGGLNNFEFIDLKDNPIKKEDLDLIVETNNLNYEDVFNKRSRKYTKGQFTTDEEFKQAILKEYTFLKRPIIQINDKFFIGNSKKVVEDAKSFI